MSVTDLPERDRPLSEQFRLVAKAWADADAAANLLEETKSASLAQRMLKLGDMPVNRAEMTVKGSDEWHEYLEEMVAARKEANLRKVQMEYIRMRYGEWQATNANARDERRMGGHGR